MTRKIVHFKKFESNCIAHTKNKIKKTEKYENRYLVSTTITRNYFIRNTNYKINDERREKLSQMS